jgi:hypothetical protein
VIIDLQRGIAEAGRIRIGQQVPTSGGRTRPEKLDRFRLTSSDRRRIEEAAGLFGGKVTPWEAPAGRQWEVITEATALDVIVPPNAMAFSQHFELWSAGGCQRRCDGQTEHLSEQPCLCDPDERAAKVKGTCEIHTRLSLMIRDLPGLALWRLDTQGWYAARELGGAIEIMGLAAGRGVMVPARLLLEQRSVKRPGKDGKPQTLRFAVPRLDLGITPGEFLLAGQPAGIPVAALAEGAPPERRLTPVPQIEGPRPSIAEQSAPPQPPPARRNAAPEIPASGRRRSAPAKVAGEDGYWQARAFAEAAERGLEADAIRTIAAGMRGVPVKGFSMSTLSEADWENVHRLIPSFATEPAPQPAPAATPAEADTDSGPGAPAPQGPSEGDGPALSDDEEAAVWRAVDEAEPESLSSEAFTAWLGEHRISTAYAKSIAAQLFPGVARLDDTQRAALARELAKGG